MASLIDQGFGVTPIGFNAPNLSDLLTQLESHFRETDSFGSDFDFDVDKVLYEFSSSICKIILELVEIEEQNFNNSTPLKAEGNPLFDKGSYIGITKRQASSSKTTVTFTGSVGTQIQTGYQVATQDDIIFTVDAGGTITGASIDLTVSAQIPGESGNVQASTITKIINPIPGLDSINNSTAAAGGQDQETESEFRDRYFQKLQLGQGNNVDGIASAILEVDGVTSAVVYENDTDATVGGIPPHRIAPVVLGGINQEIADKIFQVKAGGPGSYGTITETVTDSQGLTHEIGFSRPTNVDIYVNITLTTTAEYPPTGDDTIKSAVVALINSLEIGQDVFPFKISSAIDQLNLPGIQNVLVELSEDDITFVNAPVTIDNNEKAITVLAKVVIL